MDFRTIKQIILPQGEMISLAVNGVKLWEKPSALPYLKDSSGAKVLDSTGKYILVNDTEQFESAYTGAQIDSFAASVLA